MKRFIWVLSICVPAMVLAGVPQPACTCFGLLKDQYGQPYLQNAQIFLTSDGRDIASQDIDGMLTHGINFQTSIEMDSGAGDRYVERAMREGETLEISVKVDGAAQPLLGPSSLVMPVPGSDIALNLTTGTDADGDGLPDEWEQQMIAASGGALTNIMQVLPEDDFDGDGASNWHEYLTGTFAFLDYDYFALEDLEKTESGKYVFRFLSVPGKSYGTELNGSLTATNDWVEATFSVGTEDGPSQTHFTGDGFYQVFYIDVDDHIYLRLLAE